MTRLTVGPLLAAFLSIGSAACDRFGSSDAIVLEGVTLIDGSGGPPVRDAVILVRDGHIQSVARVNEIDVPRGATVLDLVGKTVIPGLIDAHAHVTEWAGPRFLAWGVTTVRDLSDDSGVAYDLKRRFNDGSAPGPRLFTSGGMIDGRPSTYPGAEGVAIDGDLMVTVGMLAVDRPEVRTAREFMGLVRTIAPGELRRMVLSQAMRDPSCREAAERILAGDETAIDDLCADIPAEHREESRRLITEPGEALAVLPFT